MSKPMNKKTAGIFGAVLWIFGATGILSAMFQQSNPGVAIIIGVCSACLVLGTRIGTVVTLSEDKGESFEEAAK